ncbi:pectate/pectin lyase PelC [Chitinophaga japonensis]
MMIAATLLMAACKQEQAVSPQPAPPAAASLAIDGPSAAANIPITSTIVVPAGQVYDGGGNTIIASGMGDGSQDEGQKPIFRLENGATLRNVKIGAPGCDGVHTYGNATLENVQWLDVGEDALTMKAQGNVTLTNCVAKLAYDKVVQVNANGNLTLNNFQVDNFGKVVRTNGSSQSTNVITINGGTFRNGTNIVRTESVNVRVRYRNISTSNVSKLWQVPNASQVSTY